nr:mitochondrial inner membrane protease ATP23 homolog isoform X4 [Peromyscus maniculatus bairdii]
MFVTKQPRGAWRGRPDPRGAEVENRPDRGVTDTLSRKMRTLNGRALAWRVGCPRINTQYPYVKLLLDAMKHSGCAVDPGRHFSCEDCDGNVSGGFDASTSQIVLCQNNIRNEAHMSRVVTHELIHAFDHCRAHVHWFTNVRHLACSEIRAASLSGDCSLVNEIFRLHFGLKQHHQIPMGTGDQQLSRILQDSSTRLGLQRWPAPWTGQLLDFHCETFIAGLPGPRPEPMSTFVFVACKVSVGTGRLRSHQ